ncbi:transposase DNA-binding-containing protein [Caballeronia sp. SEWSISQ10-4 2]|uniref:transposase DNA-binding-containing protein n=1 Tax=Caballeronia sp. SEWSISQ10-4 2 TaxID=2937438 RepID=UPI0034627D8B
MSALTSRLVALAWRLANTPDRSFPCALDATQRDAAYGLFDMTRSMQTAPSNLTSSIPCRAGAGDNCHSQELLGR